MFILFFIVFINLVGFGIIIPLLPFYGEHYGASPDQVTLLMAIYSLAQFITAPIWGRISDKYGRRPVLLFSLAGTAIAYVWLALASDLTSLYLVRAWGALWLVALPLPSLTWQISHQNQTEQKAWVF